MKMQLQPRESAARQASQQARVSVAAQAGPNHVQLQKLDALARQSTQLAQLHAMQKLADQHVQQPARNQTGLPNQLKAGVEALSGVSLDNVRVHYHSSKPAQLNAKAYAQGSDIHLGPGQEAHLPHEAWHVVQQAQGRVKATTQMKGDVPVNDDPTLEHEADVMGQKALQAAGMTRASGMRALAAAGQQRITQQVRDNFTAEQRARALAKNRRINNGFYTCTHCGFQHQLVNYATYQGRRMGDGGFQIDHIQHASRGGRALMRNARVLCGTCNISRGNRPAPGRRGIDKYRALHRKAIGKNYLKKPSRR